MVNFKYLLGIGFSITCGWAVAQGIGTRSDSTTLLIGGQVHMGSILPHSSSIAHLSGNGLRGLQVDLSRIRYTRRSWEACNCFSQNGISLSYFDFGFPETLGQALTLAVFAEPRLTYGRFNAGLRAGAGVSYLTRVYHPEENPENIFFSVPWSGLLLAQISGKYQVNPRWLVRAGLSYHHISNGGQRQPNLGMNFPTVDLGVEYSLKYFPPQRRKENLPADGSLKYYLGIFYNTRAVDDADLEPSDREPVLGFQGGVYKPVARMHAIGVGAEFSHDRALLKRAALHDETYGHHILSALLRHHLLFGRFDFSQALGIYIIRDYPTPSGVFQRYALTYRFWRKITLGFSLKAHLHTAEQMDFRLGLVL